MKQSDHDILCLFKKNEQEGIRAAFEKYYLPLCAYATRFLGNYQAAEDVVQGVFVRCWQNRSFHSIQSSLQTFLYVSVRNSCLNELERIGPQRQVSLGDAPPVHDAAHYDPVPEPVLLQGLEQAIGSLPEKCREVFVLVVMEELTYKETAAKLGITINTVKTQLSRAFRKLRHQLAHYLSH